MSKPTIICCKQYFWEPPNFWFRANKIFSADYRVLYFPCKSSPVMQSLEFPVSLRQRENSDSCEGGALHPSFSRVILPKPNLTSFPLKVTCLSKAVTFCFHRTIRFSHEWFTCMLLIKLHDYDISITGIYRSENITQTFGEHGHSCGTNEQLGVSCPRSSDKSGKISTWSGPWQMGNIALNKDEGGIWKSWSTGMGREQLRINTKLAYLWTREPSDLKEWFFESWLMDWSWGFQEKHW